jgi:hypothetical protein
MRPALKVPALQKAQRVLPVPLLVKEPAWQSRQLPLRATGAYVPRGQSTQKRSSFGGGEIREEKDKREGGWVV